MKKILDKNIKYKLALFVTILGLIGLISGTSYAVLKGNTTSEREQIIKVGSVLLKLTENYESINKKITTLSDEEGLLQEEVYSFNIKNIGDVTTKFDLKLVNKVPSDYTGEVLDEKYIKIGLEINDVEHGPFGLKEVNNIIDSNIIMKNEIINYKLRIWLDEEKQEELMILEDYKSFLTLEVEAEQSEYKSLALDKSGANAPALSENMIPVYYDETCNDYEGCWKKADSTNWNVKHPWYDYDNKMWANSVTVSTNSEGVRTDLTEAPEGTEIPMDRILTMQVWVPRYKYTVWNYNSDGTATSNPQEIDIQFERGTTTSGEIECTDLTNMGTSDGTKNGTQKTTSETCTIKSTEGECTDDTCNGLTYTHPAFTFGDKELTGIWVGKFEVSVDSGTTCSPATRSAIGAACNLTTIKPLVKPNVTSWRGAMVGTFENNMMAMNNSGNKYGFATTDDTHMIKNMEWGAVAYLSHSKYGINKEIALNSNSSFTTGCGPQSEGSTSSGSTCNAYNTVLGQSASTTGNIYGIYDMSGGATEYVMGNMISPNGTTMMSGYRANTSYPNDHSGYSGILYYNGTTSAGYGSYTGTYEYPDNKYYDKYSFNTSETTRGRSKLGDAIKEVYASSYGWYSDNSYLAYSYDPWFNRGGDFYSGRYAGVFASYNNYGNAYSNYSARLVILQ